MSDETLDTLGVKLIGQRFELKAKCRQAKGTFVWGFEIFLIMTSLNYVESRNTRHRKLKFVFLN